MKCEDTSKLIIDKLAGELSARQSAALDKHIEKCDKCRKEFEDFSELWDLTDNALKEDSFAEELTPTRNNEILDAAHKEKKPGFFSISFKLNRITELAALVVLCFILAGMFLPALNAPREKARRISLASQRRMEKLDEMVANMEAEEVAAKKAKAEKEDFFDSDSDSVNAQKTLRGVMRAEGVAGAEPPPARASKLKSIIADDSKETADRIDFEDVEDTEDTFAEESDEESDEEFEDESVVESVEVESPFTVKPDKGRSRASDASASAPVAGCAAPELKSFAAAKKEIKSPPPQPSIQYAKKIRVAKKKIAKSNVTRKLEQRKKRAEDILLKDVYNEKAINELREVNKQLVKNGTRRLYRQSKERSCEVNWKLKAPKQKIKSYKKSFKLNLKLWNLTTTSSIRKYLKDNKCSVPKIIWIDKKNNTIHMQSSKAKLDKIEKLFKQLQQEEKELTDFSDGLPFIKCQSRPLSTFSIDTDTASYIQARKAIKRGERPEPLKIRPEEFINYFDYNYRSPINTTFAVYPEAAPSPFRPNNTSFRIGIQGKRLGPNAGSSTHYTILLDTSGSMAVKDRMELARKALDMLFRKLKSNDYISLLVCGTKTSIVFRQFKLYPGNRKKLLKVLNSITPKGTADFAVGIARAYAFADKYYLKKASNRIVIISDGIFELDQQGKNDIKQQIEKARKRGISNIVIGLGGDGDDTMLEQVAAQGDGSYVFLDNEREAAELFGEKFEARFREIARDVKIQVEFNPSAVKYYRQIGYKNRQLAAADFRNDKVDAGEVGSGQSVTALYELKLAENIPQETIIATVRIRYKRVEDMGVEEKAFYLSAGDVKKQFNESTANFKLAAYVAEFAEALRYPETSNIASPRAIKNKLEALRVKDYAKSFKVAELVYLINLCK